MNRIGQAMRSASSLLRGEATLQQVRDVWEILASGDHQKPVIYYGPYDAIWPTVGVEGFAWHCQFCGLNLDGFPAVDRAQADAESHCTKDHFHVDMTLVEVHLDPDEIS